MAVREASTRAMEPQHSLPPGPAGRRILRCSPGALDIGCGEGTLTRALAGLVPSVTGIDLDRPSIELARTQDGPHVEYVLGDFLEHPFAPEAFDVIVSVATLHHVDAAAGLRRMRELLSPGGTLAVLGCARFSPRYLPVELAAVLINRWRTRGREYWEHPSPTVWPPALSYVEHRRLAQRLLPGVRYRRHLYWRYSLIWRKPGPA